MEPKDILHLYDLEMRIDPPDWQTEVYRRPGLTYLTAPEHSPHNGWVLYTQLEDPDADELIHAVVAFFKTRGGDFEWKVYDHDRPFDLKERLRGLGLIPQELEALLAFDLETTPAQFWKSASSRVRRITDPNELPLVAQVQEEVWDEPFSGLVEMLASEMRDTPEGISVYMAEVDGQPASCAWVRYHQDRRFAELYGGSTIERYRGQGLYTALIMARAQEARQRGVRFLTVDTSPMSRPILEKLGFVFLTHSQPWVYPATNSA
jgi:GNAT superfamily N-acetyltransferase